MRLHFVSCLVLAATSVGFATDPMPKPDPIRLPVTPTPAPSPAPAPSGVTSLSGDQLYVIDSDVACLVLTSPSGIVSVTEDAGPVKIRGRFVDGNGKSETRTYKGKSVYTLETVASGRVELLIVPQGGAPADVIRRTLDVTAGQDPSPPPKPTPPPNPVVPANLWGFVIVEATADAVAARGTLLADPMLAALVKGKSYHWRIVDKDVVGVDGKPPSDVARMLEASKGKNYPQLFLVDVKGNVVTQTNLPTTPPSLVELLKKYGQ